MISKEEVQRVSKLARIHLTEKEAELFETDFSQILDYFKVLGGVNTTKVQPMTHAFLLENITREDIPQKLQEGLLQRLLELVPSLHERFIKVKAVFK